MTRPHVNGHLDRQVAIHVMRKVPVVNYLILNPAAIECSRQLRRILGSARA